MSKLYTQRTQVELLRLILIALEALVAIHIVFVAIVFVSGVACGLKYLFS